MSVKSELKKPCRTPNAKGVTHIPLWKYERVHQAIMDTLISTGGRGMSFKELRLAAREKIPSEALETLGSWGWHFTTVKLEMEVAGDISRVKGKTPQHIILGAQDD